MKKTLLLYFFCLSLSASSVQEWDTLFQECLSTKEQKGSLVQEADTLKLSFHGKLVAIKAEKKEQNLTLTAFPFTFDIPENLTSLLSELTGLPESAIELNLASCERKGNIVTKAEGTLALEGMHCTFHLKNFKLKAEIQGAAELPPTSDAARKKLEHFSNAIHTFETQTLKKTPQLKILRRKL